jgi:Zn-finger nucleic acid-binding protein
LASRRLGDFPVAVLECQRCAGIWLSLVAMEEILVAESRGAGHSVGQPASSGIESEPQRGYRRCAQCGELMARRNLARGKSGVVVDLCGRHGIWFDADELAQLIAWTRTGGLEQLRRDLARLVGSRDDVRRRHADADDVAPRGKKGKGNVGDSMRVPSGGDDGPEWLLLAGQIAAGLLRLL